MTADASNPAALTTWIYTMNALRFPAASLALDFTSGPASGVATGVTMYYQWWHRDMTTGGSNLSEGLSVTWLE